jgi:leader peptidase (prepilin peptidase) / N-methyltransferase
VTDLTQTQLLSGATLFLFGVLISISVVDSKRMIIPNTLNAGLALSGFLVSVFVLQSSFLSVIFQTTTVFFSFLGIAKFYAYLRNTHGLGGGDVKFISAATCWVGVLGLPWTLLIASLSGLTFALISHLMGNRLGVGQRLAFGPHLALGLFATWMMRDAIFNFPA